MRTIIAAAEPPERSRMQMWTLVNTGTASVDATVVTLYASSPTHRVTWPTNAARTTLIQEP